MTIPIAMLVGKSKESLNTLYEETFITQDGIELDAIYEETFITSDAILIDELYEEVFVTEPPS